VRAACPRGACRAGRGDDAADAVRLRPDAHEAHTNSPKRRIMKLALIAIGLLATASIVYAACVFC
jgi:hypothetical protein